MPVTPESPTGWPIVARDSEFRRALAALRDDAAGRGVALMGSSGVGKSTLAHALADTLRSSGRPVRFALGTQTCRAVPLGAFYRSVTVNVTLEPAAMLAAAHHTLQQDANLVVVVDDAQLLDPLSATLVYQLAVSEHTRLIVVIRSDDLVPDVVTALWKERLLRRLNIEAFTWEQTGQLASAVLGGAVENRLVDELYRRTAGNLLLLRGLLSAGRENGALVPTESGWQLRGELRGDNELFELLEFRLRSLAPEELDVVEVLAAAEVLDWNILRAICDADAAARLERRGLIQLVPDGSHLIVRLNHPVIGEAALRHAGMVRTRQLNSLLAQELSQRVRSTALPDERSQIRMAQFLMRSDLPPDLDVIVHAAQTAVAISNIVAAEELAAFALDRGGGLAAAIVLAEAKSWWGHGREAEALLSGFSPDVGDELLTMRWGRARAANLFWGCGRVDEARAVLAEVKDRIHSPDLLGLVTAMEMAFSFSAGDLPPAIAAGLAMCESELPSETKVWAAVPTCWALALSGRFSEAAHVADAGRRATALGESRPQRFAMELAEVIALTAAGDLSGAERAWENSVATAAAVGQAEAISKATLGLVNLAQGALDSASTALRESVSVISGGMQSGWVMLVSAWLVQAEGGRGDADAAAVALKRAEDANGPQVAVFLPELELARAWERACVGQTTAAQEHARRAAQIARRSAMLAVEMRALHTAARFGDHTHKARLTEIARILRAPIADAVVTHAQGLADHNGDLLDTAADRFTAIGAMALAADAAAQAAREHARTGQRCKELESLARTHWLANQDGLHTPAIEAVAQPLPITDREREIAKLVAAGLSNRQIADRLGISVRTVDGHLYRIFAKLDIKNRDQLARFVGIADEL